LSCYIKTSVWFCINIATLVFNRIGEGSFYLKKKIIILVAELHYWRFCPTLYPGRSALSC